MSVRRCAMLAAVFAFGAGLAVAPTAGAAATPPAVGSPTPPAVVGNPPAAGTARLTDANGSTLVAGIATLQIKPGYEAQANKCIRLWKPYGQKIKGKWHVVTGGRLQNCGATYFKVTLQQKRAWGWDDRSSKTIFRKGDVNPKAKCKTFGTYSWRTTGVWYRYTTGGKVQTLGQMITKSWRTKC
ncbi:hypothetical protein [Actinoplanes sp. NPDC049802]|uniref:hypothetical protein n=1 Tax=Actinoplanes sp. NPDC049802 TaxID=3154742 RepID=UPI00340CAEA3